MSEWHDYWRLLNFVIASAIIYMLGRRYAKHSSHWNTKTLDLWYALTVWCVTGLALSLEGILRESEIGARLVFISLALFVTLKGLLRKGSWGETRATS